MKKAICILLLSFSFFVFNIQMPNAQDRGQIFDFATWTLRSKASLNGLEVSDHKKVNLEVHLQIKDKDNSQIGLTEKIIRTRCELRLRQAGLEPIPSRKIADEYLSVAVNVLSTAFMVSVRFCRSGIFDGGKTPYLIHAVTWQKNFYGTHSNDPEFIMSGLDARLDSFINEYLMANAKQEK
jgi:hypothetical protein